MWWVILICASGVSCGITHPIAKQTSAESVEQCQQVGELAIDLARYDRTEFRIRKGRRLNFDRFVGIPYADKGRDPAIGLDCWGLVALVMRELRGVELPSYAEQYVTAADRVAMASLIAGRLDTWSMILPGQEQAFDGVLMREGRFPRHIGIVTSPGQLLHVSQGFTSRIERYRSGPLAARVFGFYRHRDS